jgi:hypothetical protein
VGEEITKKLVTGVVFGNKNECVQSGLKNTNSTFIIALVTVQIRTQKLAHFITSVATAHSESLLKKNTKTGSAPILLFIKTSRFLNP